MTVLQRYTVENFTITNSLIDNYLFKIDLEISNLIDFEQFQIQLSTVKESIFHIHQLSEVEIKFSGLLVNQSEFTAIYAYTRVRRSLIELEIDKLVGQN